MCVLVDAYQGAPVEVREPPEGDGAFLLVTVCTLGLLLT